MAHRDTVQEDGLLSRGETIASEIDEASTVPVLLEAGEVSFHRLEIGAKACSAHRNRVAVRSRSRASQLRSGRRLELLQAWLSAAARRGFAGRHGGGGTR